MNIFEKLQALDRRYIYLVLAVAIILPLIIPYNSKTYTTRPSESLYSMIDSFSAYHRLPNDINPEDFPSSKDFPTDLFLEHDRAVLLVFMHDAGVLPELFPMELAILRHCFDRKIKVFAITFLATAAPIIDYAINTVKAEEQYQHVTSGVDYVNFGFKVSALYLPIILGMGEDIAEAVDIDAEGRKISSLPIMTNIKNYNNMNLIVELSASSAGGAWITYARPRFGVNVAVGVTAVMAADYYPQLQTGQLIGMLAGLKGAAEYEKMVDVFASQGREFSKDVLREEKEDDTITNPNIPYKFKQARIGMNAQSVAHILIIVFILIGNIGYFVTKYQKSKEMN